MKKGKIIGIVSIIAVLVLGLGLGLFLLLCPKDKPTYSVRFVVGDAINATEFEGCIHSGEISKPSNYPMSENMYFDGWYLDRDYLNKANFPLNIEEDVVLYAKYLQGNLPSSNIAYNDAKGEYYICGKLANVGITTLVIPDIYNDGTNGIHKLTYIENVSDTESLLTNNQNVKKLYIGNNIDTINEYFAYNSACIESVTFGLNVAKIAGTAFKLCVNINDAGFVSDGWYNVGANDLYNCEVEWLQRTTRTIKFITYIDESGTTLNFNNADDSSYDTIEYKESYTIASKPVLPILNNYMLVDWYLDAAFTNRLVVPLTVTTDIVLYPRMMQGTIPASYYGTYSGTGVAGYKISTTKYKNMTGCATKTVCVIPDYFDNGTNDLRPVTYLAGSGESYALLYQNTVVKEVWIGNNVSNVPKCFADGGSTSDGAQIETIFVGRGVTIMGDEAFRYQTKVKTFYYYATECGDKSTVEDYITCAMGTTSDGCSLIIGDNVKKIPNYMFGSCDGASHNINGTGEIYIPESVTSIGNYGFFNCKGFESIVIGNNVTTIGTRAFKDCVDVKSIVIGNKVATIGTYAFEDCSSLESIIISASVTSIGNSAFSGTSNLKTIQYDATECGDLESGNKVFYNAGSKSGAIEVIIGANVKKIPEYLFNPYSSSSSYCPRITTVTFEENSICEYIGKNAFKYCTSLTEVDFGTNSGFWWVTDDASGGGSVNQRLSEDLTDPTIAAECLVNDYVGSYWVKQKNSVVYDTNGGVFQDGSNSLTEFKVAGNPIGDLPIPTKVEGGSTYEFLGWATDDNPSVYIDSSYIITEDVVFHAQWKKL